MSSEIHTHGLFGLREKLSLALASLLILVLLLGFHQWRTLNALEVEVQQILDEDIQMLGAIDRMQDGIERIDNGISFLLLDESALAEEQIEVGQLRYLDARERAAEIGRGPEIENRLNELDKRYEAFLNLLDALAEHETNVHEDERRYIEQMDSEFSRTQQLVEGLEDLIRVRYLGHQADAHRIIDSSKQQTIVVAVIALLFAGASIYLTSRWVLFPILRLTEAANRVRSGDYSVQVEQVSQDEIGELTGTFNAMTEEISTYQNTQKANLLKLHSATQTIFTNIDAAIALIAPDGQVERSTSIAKDVFGLVPDGNIADCGQSWLIQLFSDVLESGEPTTLSASDDVLQIFVDGEERFYYASGIPVQVLNDQKVISNVLIVVYDVTQMRLHEELKHDAISTVSHQLKTPLTSIRMALHLLADGKLGELNDQQADLAGSAKDESDRLFRMVEGLLDMSRIKSGQVMLECGPTNIVTTVEDAIHANRYLAEEKEIGITLDADENLPAAWADESRLQHVFLNLVNNAVKYTPNGGTVRVDVRGQSDFICIAIDDSGPGVAKPDRERIFDQFYRGSEGERSSGAGLGLAIVYQLVSAHGGSVIVEDSELGGAQFIVHIPTIEKAIELGYAPAEAAC